MRSDVCGAIASRSYANAGADSASACTLTSPLLRSRFLLILLHLLPRDTHPLSFALYAHSPPTSTRSHRISCSHPRLLLPSPVPSSVLHLFPSQRVPPPFCHLRSPRHSPSSSIYILYHSFPASRSVPCGLVQHSPPFLSLPLSPSILRRITYQLSLSVLGSHLRTTYVPLHPFFSFALSSRLRYQVLSPCLRVPAALFRFVEIYSFPLVFLSCFILSRSTSALKLLSICQRVYRFVSPSRYLLAILSFIILHFNVLIIL